MNRIFYLLILALVYFFACQVQDKETKEEVVARNYPETKKVNAYNFYFGDTVPDPYRWLENDTSAQTADWTDELRYCNSFYKQFLSDSVPSDSDTVYSISTPHRTVHFRSALVCTLERLLSSLLFPIPIRSIPLSLDKSTIG